jgi:hypothetical protein
MHKLDSIKNSSKNDIKQSVFVMVMISRHEYSRFLRLCNGAVDEDILDDSVVTVLVSISEVVLVLTADFILSKSLSLPGGRCVGGELFPILLCNAAGLIRVFIGIFFLLGE